MNRQEIRTLLESLAGQRAPIDGAPADLEVLGSPASRLGYSQLNELLLLFGFDRITHAFFQFLVDGQTEHVPGQAFASAEQLRDGVDRFRELAVLLYGYALSTADSVVTDVRREMRETWRARKKKLRTLSSMSWPHGAPILRVQRTLARKSRCRNRWC